MPFDLARLRASPLRFFLLLTAAAVFVAGSLRFTYLRIITVDRAELAAEFVDYPDHPFGEYKKFLDDVAQATPPGSTVAILVAMRRWDDGYSYAYYRASFVLAGRTVLPLVWDDDRLLPANLARARYVASWRMRMQPPGFRPIGSSHGGVLLERVR